jgi:hypothetical protein
MRLLERALDTVVVTIHHPPKGDGDQLRGSGALENNVDFAIRFEREENAMRTRVSARKQKNGPKFSPFTVAFAAADDGLVMAGVEAGAAPTRGQGAVFTPGEREVFDLFVEHRAPWSMAEWTEAAIEELGVSEGLVRKTRTAAAGARFIRKVEGRRWELTGAGLDYAGATVVGIV